jgi:tryptophan synthase alpha chain
MNRIDRIFSQLRAAGRKGLMPFLTAGDPDLESTAAMLPALQRAGACICELGIPFSDPIADGPVIQASMTHALSKGLRTAQVLEVVKRLRASLEIGIIAMVSYSIVYRVGHLAAPSDEDGFAFLRAAKDAGIDGFIIPDLPIEEAGPVIDACKKLDLACSFLISPSTPGSRALQIAKACTGFVYVLSRAGLTGEQQALPTDLHDRLRRIRAVTTLPIAVGFGISNRQQVEQVTQVADAAIVGSAIMRRIAPMRDKGREAVVKEVEGFVKELAGG